MSDCHSVRKSPTFVCCKQVYISCKTTGIRSSPAGRKTSVTKNTIHAAQRTAKRGTDVNQRKCRERSSRYSTNHNNTPRPLTDTKTVPVKLKRKLSYTSAAFTENVRPLKVLAALHYLMNNGPVFQEAGIRVDETWLRGDACYGYWQQWKWGLCWILESTDNC